MIQSENEGSELTRAKQKILDLENQIKEYEKSLDTFKK